MPQENTLPSQALKRPGAGALVLLNKTFLTSMSDDTALLLGNSSLKLYTLASLSLKTHSKHHTRQTAAGRTNLVTQKVFLKAESIQS